MDAKRSWRPSIPLTMEFVMPNWLKFIPQTSHQTCYIVAKIFNSPISAGTYHDQRIATLMLWGVNQFAPWKGWGCTFWKGLCHFCVPMYLFANPTILSKRTGKFRIGGFLAKPPRTAILWLVFYFMRIFPRTRGIKLKLTMSNIKNIRKWRQKSASCQKSEISSEHLNFSISIIENGDQSMNVYSQWQK